MTRHTFASLFLVLIVSLAASTSAWAQAKGHIEIREDVMAGTSMQIYMDFSPFSAPGGIPPLITAPEDTLVIIDAVGSDLTSAGFGALLAGEMNNAFRIRGQTYTARFREKDGERVAHDAVTVSGPVSLQGLYISPDAVTHPNTLVTGAAGISFNPTFGDISRRIENAYPGSPNAQLFINDIDPALDKRHQVEVFAPGPLKFGFNSGANSNQPIVFLLSNFYNPETIPQAFIGFPGSLDIGTHNGTTFQNVAVIADGISGSSPNPFLDQFFVTDQNGQFDFQISLSNQAAGTSIAAQAIIADPTQLLGLAFTQAANINAAIGKEVVLPLGDDLGSQVTFEPGHTFDFYGATYSAININANGFVSFGGAPLSGPAFGQIDPVTAISGQPSIFANWADWDTTGVGVTYREFGRELRISWGSLSQPISHSGVTDAGSFSLTLHLDVPSGTAPPSQRFAGDGVGSFATSAGSVFIDSGLLMSGTTNVAGFDSVAGISPGGIMAPMIALNDSFSLPFYPQNANRPYLIQHDRSDSAQSTLPVASGGSAIYRNGSSQAARTLSFFPTPAGLGISYNAIADRDQADDVQGADVSFMSVSNIGSGPFVFSMVGYFRYLYGGSATVTPTVELINAATQMPIATAVILDVMTPNGPADAGTLVAAPSTVFPASGYRPFEGAVLRLPPGSLNPGLIGVQAQLRVTFASGSQLLSRDMITIMP